MKPVGEKMEYSTKKKALVYIEKLIKEYEKKEKQSEIVNELLSYDLKICEMHCYFLLLVESRLFSGFYINGLEKLENIFLGSSEFTEEEALEIILEMVKEDINILSEKKEYDFVVPDTLHHLKQYYHDALSYEDLEKSNPKKMWISKIKSKGYDTTLLQLFFEKQKKVSQSIYQSYQILKECYFDKNECPELSDYKKIRTALSNLGASPKFQKMVLPHIKIQRVNTNEETHISITFLKNYKLGLTDREYKELNEEANKYYDFNGDLPRRNLDLLEKIHFITILQKLEYSEEEIKRILWSIDKRWSQTKPSNKPDDKSWTMQTIWLLMHKESGKMISADFQDIIKEIENNTGEERLFWIQFLEDFLKETTREYLNDAKKAREDIAPMSIHHKETYRNAYLYNLEETYGSNLANLRAILKLRTKSKDAKEREIFESSFNLVLERFQMEQYGSLDFEIAQAKRIRKKEENHQ